MISRFYALKTTIKNLLDYGTSRSRGLLAAVTIALAATFLAEHYGAPVMLMALLLGMPLHFLATESRSAPGVELASTHVLRIGVALLGARITAEQVIAIGPTVVLVVVVTVVATLTFSRFLAHRLGMTAHFGLLTGGATAICGASAALAISSVLPRYPGRERDTLFAVIGVTTLSTLAMIFYPILSVAIGLDDTGAGTLIGATIHDVAQVVGAGYSISTEAGDTATLTKLLRVALLVPIIATLAVVYRPKRTSSGDDHRLKLPIPGFLIGFVILVGVNSSGVLPEWIRMALVEFSRWSLVTAIAAIGMKTSLKSLVDVGGRAITLILAETTFLLVLVLTFLFTV